ncbi:NAD-P-binding protein [Amylostereum chailletii]|nr:NAD-P-binding protein [Amylostereum chailletii]
MSEVNYRQGVIGGDENLPVAEVHGVYPTIDPKVHFEKASFKGKVVLVTGASRGIGQQTAVDYARAGATVVIVSRQQEALDETKNIILKVVPQAQVLAIPVDVKNSEQAAKAVETAVERFGRLDVLIANAGTISPFTDKLEDKDPLQWWNVLEVNLFGVFNFVRAAGIDRPSLVHLKKVNGYVVAISSVGAQYRNLFGSDYCISKHALGRLVEFVRLEYPEIKTFSLHPGGVRTQLAVDGKLDPRLTLDDPPELAAATMLYLTSGNADWLSGRYVSSNWDLGEVERDWKSKIVEQGGLVSKLFIPK